MLTRFDDRLLQEKSILPKQNWMVHYLLPFMNWRTSSLWSSTWTSLKVASIQRLASLSHWGTFRCGPTTSLGLYHQSLEDAKNLVSGLWIWILLCHVFTIFKLLVPLETESIYIEDNKFSGTIPDEVCALRDKPLYDPVYEFLRADCLHPSVANASFIESNDCSDYCCDSTTHKCLNMQYDLYNLNDTLYL